MSPVRKEVARRCRKFADWPVDMKKAARQAYRVTFVIQELEFPQTQRFRFGRLEGAHSRRCYGRSETHSKMGMPRQGKTDYWIASVTKFGGPQGPLGPGFFADCVAPTTSLGQCLAKQSQKVAGVDAVEHSMVEGECDIDKVAYTKGVVV